MKLKKTPPVLFSGDHDMRALDYRDIGMVATLLFFSATLAGCVAPAGVVETSSSQVEPLPTEAAKLACFCNPSAAAVSCTSLGAVFTGGSAVCRSDCRGYDVSSCSQVNTQLTGTSGQTVIPKLRDSVTYKDSVCSFGDPFSFRISLSPTKSKKWVIFLGGGGVCDGTVTPCTDRPENLFRSAAKTEGVLASINSADNGITSRDPVENPTFWDANFAVAAYCTNDLWSGTNAVPQSVLIGPSAAPYPHDVVFTGKRNVEAIFGSLVRYFGLDDRDVNTRVLFSGNSAGGNGVQNTADVAVNSLPVAAKDQRIWFVSSAGYMLTDWMNLKYSVYGNGKTDSENSATMATIYKATFSPECVALAKEKGRNPGDCLGGMLWYEALTERLHQKRVLVFKNRLDQIYLSFHLFPLPASLAENNADADRKAWFDLGNTELAGVRWLMTPADPEIDDGKILQDNMHGIFKDYLWDLVPPTAIQKNTCSTSAPTAFREMLTRFWNDSNPGLSTERYCFEGDWVTWVAPK